MTVPTTSSIALIVCSTRKPRACPQIAAFVQQSITKYLASAPPSLKDSNPTITVIDLAEWDLPMYNESTVPSQIHNHEDYSQPHTKAWSQEIQKFSGFIFVTPQYNWGYPAVLKNAIDYLFNEWVGKSAMIVSYGGHGGGRAAGQLKQVLQGVDMKPVETMPALTFPSRGFLKAAATGGDLELLGENGVWSSEEPTINKAFEELVVSLATAKV